VRCGVAVRRTPRRRECCEAHGRETLPLQKRAPSWSGGVPPPSALKFQIVPAKYALDKNRAAINENLPKPVIEYFKNIAIPVPSDASTRFSHQLNAIMRSAGNKWKKNIAALEYFLRTDWNMPF
jgi:hypothetical protein